MPEKYRRGVVAPEEQQMNPLVSICLPNLNTRPFLPQRMDSILAQTFTDWELIISDNYSDDGSWEFFQQFQGDPRIKISQAPRAGMYANWNECLRRATGQYVYIATSDDTMAPDCLEKLVAAVERHPDCAIAHCPLKTYDEHGQPVDQRWFPDSTFVRSGPDWLARRHIRLAPFDGLLHLLRYSVYWSITQLLIRRDFFERTGPFYTQWGSAGDFHWCFRAGLLGNTVHVPDTWGGWRIHSAQATPTADTSSPTYRARHQEMIEHALQLCRHQLPATWARRLTGGWYRYLRDREELQRRLAQRATRARRLGRAIAGLWHQPQAACDWFRWRILGNGQWPKSDLEIVADWMRQLGFREWLIACD